MSRQLPRSKPLTKTIRLQRWQSDDELEEIHIYDRGSDTYIIGFNPELVDYEDVATILRSMGFNPVPPFERRG